jgi:hypothetical protein
VALKNVFYPDLYIVNANQREVFASLLPFFIELFTKHKQKISPQIAQKNEIALCFSIDVFGKSYSTCLINLKEFILEIEKIADNINENKKAT